MTVAEPLTVTGTPAPPAPTPESESEYESRIAALRGVMRRRGLAAIMLASPESIYHALGLNHLGYFALTLLVVPQEGQPVLVARQMETPTLRAQVPRTTHLPYTDGQDPAAVTGDLLTRLLPPGAHIGAEQRTTFLSPAVLDRIRTATPQLHWVESSHIPAALRMVKSTTELERTRHAALISSTAMRAALAATGPGVNERAIAARTHSAMIEAGGEPPGFVPLIRSTTRLDQEHTTWTDHTLDRDEGLFIELSGCVQRYHAPMARIVYCGPTTSDIETAAEAARAGQEAARAALVPGALTREVYGAWEDAVADATGTRQRRHHCGYLTGIGFPPSWVGGTEILGIRHDGELSVRPGMVFHLMSWVTEPVAHVVSDTALVTADGCELLTEAPRDLLVVP